MHNKKPLKQGSILILFHVWFWIIQTNWLNYL